MRMIDADVRVTVNSYYLGYEEYKQIEMSVAEVLDFATDEGCPPAVDAVPVIHSFWHWTQDGYVYCENCTFPLAKTKVNIDGVEKHLYLTTNYCPHCGAKMDGKQEGK